MATGRRVQETAGNGYGDLDASPVGRLSSLTGGEDIVNAGLGKVIGAGNPRNP